MRIVISDSQLEYIIRTDKNFVNQIFESSQEDFPISPVSLDILGPMIKNFSHEELETLAILVLFIPEIGLLLSSAVMVVDSLKYAKEGDNTTAIFTALFSLIPVAGLAMSHSIKQLMKPEVLKPLLYKIKNKIKVFTNTEKTILNWIKTNVSKISKWIYNMGLTIINKIKQYDPKSSIGKKILTIVKKAASWTIQAIEGYIVFRINELLLVPPLQSMGVELCDEYLDENIRYKVEKEGYNWDEVKTEFLSDSSCDDNYLLLQAWDKGWRPGDDIPKQYRTPSKIRNSFVPD